MECFWNQSGLCFVAAPSWISLCKALVEMVENDSGGHQICSAELRAHGTALREELCFSLHPLRHHQKMFGLTGNREDEESGLLCFLLGSLPSLCAWNQLVCVPGLGFRWCFRIKDFDQGLLEGCSLVWIVVMEGGMDGSRDGSMDRWMD